MSDFLTNLVMRSFSPTASVQPLGATAYPGSEILGDPVEGISDPFVAGPIPAEIEEVAAETEAPTTQKQQPAKKPPARLEARIESAPVVKEQESIEAPLVTEPITTPAPRKIPPTPEPRLETPAADVSLTSAETTVNEPAPLSPKKSQAIQTPPERSVEPPAKATPKEAPSLKTRTSPSIESRPTQRILQRRTIGKPNDNTAIVNRAPINPLPSIRGLTGRIRNATISFTPQTLASSPLQIDSRTTQATTPELVERVVERAPAPVEERQQVSPTFTTLIPKTSTERLLPINIKSRPNVPSSEPRDEPVVAGPTPETVINVAIGRIEVRATSAPPAKRERQTSGPRVMNLDDYVQQRSRGAQ